LKEWAVAGGLVTNADWEVNRAMANKKIIVNLKDQKLVAYEDDKEKFRFDVVTGTGDKPTLPGEFKVWLKVKDYHSNTYNTDMPYSLFFSKDKKAFHAGLCCVSIESFIKAVAEDLVDWLGSHGCVRLEKSDAKQLFEWAEKGTDVSIIKG
jgi:hypothetical protein